MDTTFKQSLFVGFFAFVTGLMAMLLTFPFRFGEGIRDQWPWIPLAILAIGAVMYLRMLMQERTDYRVPLAVDAARGAGYLLGMASGICLLSLMAGPEKWHVMMMLGVIVPLIFTWDLSLRFSDDIPYNGMWS